MRGAPPRLPRILPQMWIIPAYAGSTRAVALDYHPQEDHPRVCGEHRPTARQSDGQGGSSPRMRGALRDTRLLVNRARIIPAYAGSTLCLGRHATTRWDHPRVCGEHYTLFLFDRNLRGSSPRMRGAPRTSTPCQAGGRIIPAYAGSTFCHWSVCASRQDHPRVCGEHYACGQQTRMIIGSSPRMRGALGQQLQVGLNVRIIPAYAGSTS